MTTAYIHTLAREMGLQGWTFEVSDEPASKHNIAEIDVTYGQRHATVFLCREWRTITPADQRSVLTHELVHALLAPLTEVSLDLIKAATGKAGRQVAEAALGCVEERVVDQIAEAWCQHLPLPDRGAQ